MQEIYVIGKCFINPLLDNILGVDEYSIYLFFYDQSMVRILFAMNQT